jgi:hypothetical protein
MTPGLATLPSLRPPRSSFFTLLACWSSPHPCSAQVFATPAVPMTPNPVAGVANFFKMGGSILASKGLGGLYFGFGFKAIHLGGRLALLAAPTAPPLSLVMSVPPVCSRVFVGCRAGGLVLWIVPVFLRVVLPSSKA